MQEFVELLFQLLGVTDPLPILATVPVIIALVAWLKARGFQLPGFTLFKWAISSGTTTTFAVSLLVGGYTQYGLGGVWYSLLAAGVLAYLAAAGIYDAVHALVGVNRP